MSAIRITDRARQSVAAVEAIDPAAARTGRADRNYLAAIAAADLVRVLDIGDERKVSAAMKVLRSRLVDAGLYMDDNFRPAKRARRATRRKEIR